MTSAAPTANLLTGPAPQITREDIDFVRGGLPEYDGLYAVILDNVLTPAECEALVNAAKATTNGVWEKALVNTGNGLQAEMLNTRKCGRIMWDDKDIVEKLWKRVEGLVPELKTLEPNNRALRRPKPGKEQRWRATRLNERMRFLKYGPGDYFKREYLSSSALSGECAFES